MNRLKNDYNKIHLVKIKNLEYNHGHVSIYSYTVSHYIPPSLVQEFGQNLSGDLWMRVDE